MGESRIGTYTIDEYLAIEQEDDRKYEYHDGRLWPVDDMAGGTWEHAVICSIAHLALAGGKPENCLALTSEIKVFVQKANRVFYPDAAVACEPEIEKNMLLNPILLLEVLSPTSEERDRGSKFETYRQIPSLQYYLLVHAAKPKIEAFSRKGEDWLQSIHYETVDLPPFYFRVADFYQGLDI